jgi:hypothetical protein
MATSWVSGRDGADGQRVPPHCLASVTCTEDELARHFARPDPDLEAARQGAELTAGY